MNVHGALNHRVSRVGVHHVKNRMNYLVALDPGSQAPRIFFGRGSGIASKHLRLPTYEWSTGHSFSEKSFDTLAKNFAKTARRNCFAMTTSRPLSSGSRLRFSFVRPVDVRCTCSIEPRQRRSTDPLVSSSAAPLNRFACAYRQRASRNIIAFGAKTQFFAGTTLDNGHSGSCRSSGAQKNVRHAYLFARSSEISSGGLPKRIAIVQ